MTYTSSHPIINQRYQVQRILGKGGMGITYEALDLQQNTLIALKEISLKNLTSAKQLELLEREIKVLQQLNHPQIPTYLDYFEIETEDNKYFYIVQQLAQGKNLHQWIQEGGRVSEREVKDIARQILQILDYLHHFNPPIIHRDIKPQNLIYSTEKKVYLVDFGAVQNAYYTTFLGGSTTIGTFGYMPLEQANGNAVPASDLYSLGATLLYLITRRSPEEFCQGLGFKIPNNLNLSEDFTNWLEKLLEPDIDDRFSSAKEALTVLQNPPNKKDNKKIWMVGMGLVAVTLSSLFLFHQYKWAMLNRLGFPAPVEVCYDGYYPGDQEEPDEELPGDREYSDQLTKDYWESGGRFSPSDFSKCLLWSVVYSHEPMVKWLMNHQVDVNRYNNSKTPLYLHRALEAKNSEIVGLLIKNGVDVNLKSIRGNTSLHYAYNAQVAEILIKNGADVHVKDNNGETPLHSVYNAQVAEILIKNGADVHVKDNNGETPLYRALEDKKLGIVGLLLKNGANVNNIKKNNGETPLYRLLKDKNSEIVDVLLKNGLNANTKDENGKTPLHHAVSNGDSGMVKTLIYNGADVNIKDQGGQTSLHHAVSNGDSGMVKTLIYNGADVNIKDQSGQTSLHHAVSSENSEIVELLVKNGADINIKNKHGKTPLHYYINNYKIAEILIKNGADINIKDKDGKTPLHYYTNNYKIAEILIKNGADINIKDKKGQTPLHYAADAQITEILIKNGADVNIKDNTGKTPLHDVAKAQIAEILIKNGAGVHVKDKDGKTPLHYAADDQIAEILIKNGAGVHVKDKDGETPLHYAVVRRNLEIVEFLIKNGADVNIKDKDGKTPLHYALDIGKYEIVEILIDNGADVDTATCKLISHTFGRDPCPSEYGEYGVPF